MGHDDAGDLLPDDGITLYPVGLCLRGCRVIVAGGGVVAERRVGRLIAAGAEVILVAPEATPALQARAEAGDIVWHRRPAAPEDFADMRLAFICTNDPSVNADLARAARARGAWVNRADAPQHSDFLVPAVADLSPVQVAVLTGGLAPTVGRYLCQQIERIMGAETAAVVALAARIRSAVRSRVATQPERAAVIAAALDEEVLAVLRSEGLEAAYSQALKKMALGSPDRRPSA
ncbi:MAG: bifunctional precorrin-2 dehydrogenase/sirohydrochlorin ferrochelatase [Candidatus Sumerlaeaceae bacterium]|nr:bifunctional precorrin-2 dehydrogenase/sirohydrochlorin ferrochelatase [Candidatus Sumerlaeaceae bacterium]